MRFAVNFVSLIAVAMAGPISLASTDHIFKSGVEDVGSTAERDFTTRSTNTCADPSLAKTIFQAFEPAQSVHLLRPHYGFVQENTVSRTPFWIDQQPGFRAWLVQQPFTVPLFQLARPDATEFVYMIGADAQTPPILSGFSSGGVAAWVYDTPVCGSVPLMSATFAPATDHYFTTDVDEHQGLVTSVGWTDTGIIAYVLPLTTS